MELSRVWSRVREGLSSGLRPGTSSLDAARDTYAAEVFLDCLTNPALTAVVNGYADDFAARLALTGDRRSAARLQILTAWANELVAACGEPQDLAPSPFKQPWSQLRLAGLCECAIRAGLLRRGRRASNGRLLASIA